MLRWKKVFRDPMFHFALAGSALFMANTYANGATDTLKIINLDQAKIEWLKATSKKDTGRLPSDEVLQNLIDNYVREEILYREALILELQHDDVVVRRRLIQKLRFLMEDVATATPPSEQELREFYRDIRQRFAEPVRYSFSHVYFQNDARENARNDAEQALAQFNDKASTAAKKPLGDPFMLPYHYAHQAPKQVANNFGKAFATGLTTLPVDQWSGPLKSAYGWHLVKLSDRQDSFIPAFEMVEQSVRNEWQQQQRAKANARSYARLREQYQVQISPGQES